MGNTTTIMSSSTTATSKHHGHHTTVKDAGIHQHKTVVDKHVHVHPVTEKHLHEHPVVEKHIHEHPVKEEHIHQHPITETHKDAATTVTKKDIGVDGPLVDGKTKIHQSSEKEVIKTHVHGTAVEKHVEVHPVTEEHIHEHPVTEKHIHQHPITETHVDAGVTKVDKTHLDADAVPKLDGKTHTHTEAAMEKTVKHEHKAVD